MAALLVITYLAMAYIAARIVISLYNILYPFVIGSPIDLRKRAGADWAVVTGATDGIGKAYAFQLAAKGFNILLISRTQSKLDATKAEINNQSSTIQVRTETFDFTTGDRNAYERLYIILDSIQIGILINNVGMCFEFPNVMHLAEGGTRFLGDITICNSLPPVLMSAAVLPQMTSRRAGIIVNISSGAARNEMPFWNVYSATKRFVLHLSEILRQEYAPLGVTIQTVAPHVVETKMAMWKAGFFGPPADKFVKEAIRSIGLIGHTTGCLAHQIQAEGLGIVPQFIVQKVVSVQAEKIRSDVLRSRVQTH